jgi:ketosteroid isomerase-like protein
MVMAPGRSRHPTARLLGGCSITGDSRIGEVNDMTTNGDVVRRLYEFIDGGQPDRRAEVMAPDAVQRWPQSGEVMRGLDRILEATRRRPSVPHVLVARIMEAGDSDSVTAEWSANYGDGKVWRNVSVFLFRGGKIVEETDYFGDPFPAPRWRADLVEIEELPSPSDH